MDNNVKIFVDFDGTISRKDIGEELFLSFGDREATGKIIEDWINEKKSAIDMWNDLCDTVTEFNQKKFDEILKEIGIDDEFYNFLDLCETLNYPVFIVSDGFDFYIQKMIDFKKYNNIVLYSNKLKNNNNTLVPSFPYTDEECFKCANCKRNHIIDNSADEDFTIYIGDGISDICASQFCDYIFAKKQLLKYCEKNRISYYPYDNFYNVIKKIEELSKKKKLKKRHQAFLKRKEIYEQG